MPDQAKGEEALNREHALCLYGKPGITLTNNRRCENCPGAARTPQYHQRRCPLDLINEPNLFLTETAAAAQPGKSDILFDPLKSLASSSGSKAVVATRSGQDHDIESPDELRSASGVLRPRLNTSSPATARSVSDPHVEVIGRKRKADHWPESSSRSEVEPMEVVPEVDDLEGEKGTEKLEEDIGFLSLDPDRDRERSKRFTGEQLDKECRSWTDVGDFIRNKPVVIFQDEELAPMEYCGINASTNPSEICLYQSLMSEPEIAGPSDEELRNE